MFRATYCAISVAAALNLLTDDLLANVVEYIASCQTYEGGLGGEPFNEAHGGYTFCGVAALSILNRLDAIDVHACLRWTVDRQMAYEGGFQGRTNKLVDSCYSFWQGATLPILRSFLQREGSDCTGHLPYFHPFALQQYIYVCSQDEDGGLRDKPGKPRDFYHTCYSLSGLSLAQHSSLGKTILGESENLLNELDPRYGVRKDKLHHSEKYFKELPRPPQFKCSH